MYLSSFFWFPGPIVSLRVFGANIDGSHGDFRDCLESSFGIPRNIQTPWKKPPPYSIATKNGYFFLEPKCWSFRILPDLLIFISCDPTSPISIHVKTLRRFFEAWIFGFTRQGTWEATRGFDQGVQRIWGGEVSKDEVFGISKIANLLGT